ETMDKLDLPSGMSVIARTAGIGRNVDELQWDLNYLMQLWRAIEGAGQSSSGAFLIYQESSLVIRAIRDYFQPDIGEILIDTDDIYEQAQQFMSHVMPDMVHRVKRYRDDVPLFSRFQIEHQIETAYSRTVPLPSGGAIVIDHTEALVSIDVNSARATRGADIETTALNTNLEAADEVARQLRLRDLGGLIVIDFIDMENAKNQREVETRLKDALRYDRARVQMGKISRFGLMELSRQRLRPSLSEGSHVTCPRCNGTGHIRDTESSALQVLRIIQEEAMKENSAAIHVQAPVDVAAFLLNEKRGEILKIETRHRVAIILIPNKHLETPHYKLERIKHDDPRLEESHASYDMAEEADTDISYSKRQKEDVKPRQEAMVKGITPDQPAPIVERKPVEPTPMPAVMAPAEEGFFSRMFGFFRKKPVVPVAAPAPAVEEKQQPSRERGERNGRGGGGGRNRGRGRGGRDRAEGDVTRAEAREETGGKKPQNGPAEPQPRQPKPPREAKEPRREGNEARREGNEASRDTTEPRREPSEPRRERGERPQRQREERKETPVEEQLLNSAGVSAPPSVALASAEQGDLLPGANLGEEETSEQSEERRRRRRRGGRNRNRRDRENGEIGSAGTDGEGSESDTVAADATEAAPLEDTGTAMPAPVAQQVEATEVPVSVAVTTEAPAQVAVEATPPAVTESQTAPAESVPAAEAEAPVAEAPAEAVAPLATPEQAVSQETPAEQVAEPVPEPRQPEPVAAAPAPAPAAAVPVAAAAPVAGGVPPAPMQIDNLREALASAGLTLAVTDPDKLRVAQEAAAKSVPMPRVPRERKPAPPVSSDPLVQVETRR
ncbi:MAG: ribonuclease, partial [Burkholderiales bacterium]